jgi:2-alkyl-3-oxoalkanoate reductase
MRVLVTGSTGFLGRHLVESLRARGHAVLALARPPSVEAFPEDVEVVPIDLRSPAGLADALQDVDVVIHAAAVTSGPRQEQFEGTVTATANLFAAMAEAGVRRVVLVSSFAVYRGVATTAAEARVLDERWPTSTPATARDTYCEMKLRQELLLEEAAWANSWTATVARPGVIFGPGHLWTNRLGYRRGMSAWFCVGGRAALPLTFVANCAEALAQLAEVAAAPGIRRVNVVDDILPTQAEYRRRLVARVGGPRVLVVVPWPVVHGCIWLLHKINEWVGEPVKLPGALRLETVRARWKPIAYSNHRLRDVGWSRPVPWFEALDTSTSTSRGV